MGEFSRVQDVVPVAGGVDVVIFRVRPSIPRCLIYGRTVFESSRQVRRATPTVVLNAASVDLHVKGRGLHTS